jgi:hypothetical protein
MGSRAALGVMVACGLLAGGVTANASEHLVTAVAAHESVVLAAQRRADEIAAMRLALSTPAAEKAAAALSIRLDRVRAAVPTLTDDEIHDLATRALDPGAGPAAGQVDPWVNDVVVVVLIVGIVVLVLNAV